MDFYTNSMKNRESGSVFNPPKCYYNQCFKRLTAHSSVPRRGSATTTDVRLNCSCGEEEVRPQSWCWQSSQGTVVLSNENREILFHPVYSSGTACVIGTERLKPNMHYYWEMKILTYLYGTDVMFGIGTRRISELEDTRYQFVSLLGSTKDSWGISYHGDILHNGLAWAYTKPFSLGSLVGISLDMCSGTMEFYINRKPLGMAFSNIRKNNYELYPMITSTAAKSAIRMTCSLELLPSLQLNCLHVVKKFPQLITKFQEIHGLKTLYSKLLFWVIPDLERYEIIRDHAMQERTKSSRQITMFREGFELGRQQMNEWQPAE